MFLHKFKRKCHHNGNSSVVCKFHRKLGHRRRNSCFCVSSKENAIIMETLVLSLSSIENWVKEEKLLCCCGNSVESASHRDPYR
jgi:hypothetical protein